MQYALLFGKPRAELIGQPVYMGFEDDLAASALMKMNDVLKASGTACVVYRCTVVGHQPEVQWDFYHRRVFYPIRHTRPETTRSCHSLDRSHRLNATVDFVGEFAICDSRGITRFCVAPGHHLRAMAHGVHVFGRNHSIAILEPEFFFLHLLFFQ